MTPEKIKKMNDNVIRDSWKLSVEKSIKNLFYRFHSDPKFILTESDLKCWLFYYLQQEKPYIPYAVHTESTHIHELSEGSTKKSNSSFRDISLLCPWEIEENEKLIEQYEQGVDLLHKGFRHRATAIHFELKLVRQGNDAGIVKDDIQKFTHYQPRKNAVREFIVIWGSRKNVNGLKELSDILSDHISLIKNKDLKKLLTFYLFDQHHIHKYVFIGNKLKQEKNIM